jgi:hypothetical protein
MVWVGPLSQVPRGSLRPSCVQPRTDSLTDGPDEGRRLLHS